jgi:hypothetical protein
MGALASCLISAACAALLGAEPQGADAAPSQALAIPPVPLPVEATRLRDGVWHLGGERHLFADAMGLEILEGVSFTVQPPRAVKGVLHSERPWENIQADGDDYATLPRIHGGSAAGEGLAALGPR